MTASIIARSAIVPVMATPTLRAEQMTQLVLGESGRIVERSGEWRRIRTDLDGYEGWVHGGYLVEVTEADAARWREEADGWSAGATLHAGDQGIRLPLRARVALDGDGVRLPDGRCGRLAEGRIPRAGENAVAARTRSPECWALEAFAGSPYEWGGVTPWGVDCSGLVQTAFAARGTILPRDSALQVAGGTAVALDAIRPGDLLFFRGEDGRAITHVAFAGEADTLIHSTVACGGVVVEPWLPGTRAAPLRERLMAARRLEGR
ncbi:MAG: C40 family peptidase [Gemmatimonadales bacterium]|nr:C40 family peptidase [Gemmatimonadales bacterium]